MTKTPTYRFNKTTFACNSKADFLEAANHTEQLVVVDGAVAFDVVPDAAAYPGCIVAVVYVDSFAFIFVRLVGFVVFAQEVFNKRV